jgi:DNA-binding CsgD family transcriptional regulator
MAMVGEPLLIALEEARLITVRPGLAGTEVATAHPLYGEVLRAGLPVLRLRRLRLALAGALEAAWQPGPHDLVRAASWRLDSGQGDDPQRLLAAARAARGIGAVPLTPRERQIAALASGGHSDRAIAGQLHISARTVQTHLAHIYAKLGINRRADLAANLAGGCAGRWRAGSGIGHGDPAAS